MSKNIQKDFDDFLLSKEHPVSKELSKKIISSGSRAIEPDSKAVFLKYFFVFIFSGFFSLAFCPQFGVSIYRENFPLFHKIFHNSPLLCGIYCGSILFSFTHLIGFLILNPYEKLIFKKKLFLSPFVLFFFTGFSFMMSTNTQTHGSSYYVSWVITLITLSSLFILYKKPLNE